MPVMECARCVRQCWVGWGGHEEVKAYIDSLVGTAERAKYNAKNRVAGSKVKTHYDKLLLEKQPLTRLTHLHRRPDHVHPTPRARPPLSLLLDLQEDPRGS